MRVTFDRTVKPVFPGARVSSDAGLFPFRDLDAPRQVWADAAFVIPELYELLKAEGYRYAIRLNSAALPQRLVAHLLTCPLGRPPNKLQQFYHRFRYQAERQRPSRCFRERGACNTDPTKF